MSRFIMTLVSSSSMNYNPNSTASQLTTKLTEVIELEGNWKVGLLEIIFPGKVEAVDAGAFYYTIRQQADTSVRCIMRPETYTIMQHVMKELRKIGKRCVGSKSEQVVNWEYLPTRRCIAFKFAKNIIKAAITLWFSEDLAELLGYDPNREYAILQKANLTERPPPDCSIRRRVRLL